jgi:hypothetical protein
MDFYLKKRGLRAHSNVLGTSGELERSAQLLVPSSDVHDLPCDDFDSLTGKHTVVII